MSEDIYNNFVSKLIILYNCGYYFFDLTIVDWNLIHRFDSRINECFSIDDICCCDYVISGRCNKNMVK